MLYDPKWEKPAETKPLEIHQRVLLRAAEIIEQRGLRQHGFGGRTNTDPVCTLRALDIAASELELTSWQARGALMVHVGCDSVINWTDAPNRTQAMVLMALRGAANAGI